MCADIRATERLTGLDIARFLAFAGMVIVNFKIVMGAEATGTLGLLTSALEGRAAATFVVLAGIGLGLAAARTGRAATIAVTLRRSVFLLAIGLVNTLIFDADILHYYAFYFLVGVFCLALTARALLSAIALVNVAFLILVFTLNYDAAWTWADYSYADFWTPAGFVRNLFFNGWHPVFPWLSFFLFGILLSRLDLAAKSVQARLIGLGATTYIATMLLVEFLKPVFLTIDPELAALATTSPIPPTPFYVMAGAGAACVTIGLCLAAAGWLHRIGIAQLLIPAGRQTLTLYVAHILIGMGTLEALGMTGGQSLPQAVTASALFSVAAVIYAILWSKLFKRGPLEALMRKVAG